MTEWTLDKILRCAERAPTYRAFVLKFPLAYSAAKNRKFLSVVKAHCGWTDVAGYRVVTDPYVYGKPSLKDVMQEDGGLLYDAIEDPNWPMECPKAAAVAEANG